MLQSKKLFYKDPKNSDIQFDVAYSEHVPFWPLKLLVVLETDEEKKLNGESNEKTWKVEHFFDECEASALVVPTIKQKGSKVKEF